MCIESLIAINKKLGQPEAANGILTYANDKLGSEVAVKEDWLSKLERWEVCASYTVVTYCRREKDSVWRVSHLLGC